MNRIYIFLMILGLVGCDNSSSVGSGQNENPLADASSGTFDPTGRVVNACAAPYYVELDGIYDGQITYVEPERNTCAWEVELIINADYFGFDPQFRQTCFIEVTLRSQQLDNVVVGNQSLCRNLDVRNRAIEPYAGPQMSSLWTDPTWPVDISMSLPSDTAPNQIFPIGSGPSQFGDYSVGFIHDGNGNIVFEPDIFTPEYWDGVLVKR